MCHLFSWPLQPEWLPSIKTVPRKSAYSVNASQQWVPHFSDFDRHALIWPHPNGPKQCVFCCLCLPSLKTMFLRFICVVVRIHSLFFLWLSSIPLSGCTTICLSIHEHSGCFQFGAIMNKVPVIYNQSSMGENGLAVNGSRAIGYLFGKKLNLHS